MYSLLSFARTNLVFRHSVFLYLNRCVLSCWTICHALSCYLEIELTTHIITVRYIMIIERLKFFSIRFGGTNLYNYLFTYCNRQKAALSSAIEYAVSENRVCTVIQETKIMKELLYKRKQLLYFFKLLQKLPWTLKHHVCFI